MLWNEIYRFYVLYIFGGYYYAGDNQFQVGQSIFSATGDLSTTSYTSEAGFNIFGRFITFGNYLSLIATIITMVVIVLICCHFIKKVYNIFAHVIA